MLFFFLKALNCAFTFLFHFGDGLVKGILGDKLIVSNTINLKVRNRVFVIKKRKCKMDNVLSTI
jgi:hypothetical protein